MINFKKLFVPLFFVAVFGFLFSLNAPSTQAMTVAEIQTLITQLQQQILALQSQLVATGGGEVRWCYDFNVNLRIGDSGSDISALQLALKKQGFLTQINNDGEFDEQTASAVVGFQEKYKDEILTPLGLKYGTGFVGKSTRAKLNKLYGCTATTTPSVTVLSPNGGEMWTKGMTQTIKWQDNTPLPSCPIGETCSPLPLQYYDIKLVSYYPPCISNICPMYPYIAPYTITKSAYGSSYSWLVGNTLDMYGSSSTAPDGSYTIQVCQTGTSICDTSDNYFSIVASSSEATTTPSVTVLSPNGGEKWEIGRTYEIDWTAVGVNKADIKLLTYYEGKESITTIASNVSASLGKYSWTVPDFDPSGSRKIGIISTVSNQTELESDWDWSGSYFSIVAATTTTVAAPEMVYPVDGQVLNYGAPNGYMFKVKPVAGASGYLFGFFQNNVMVYENWRDNRQLSSNGEFAIWPENQYYSAIKEGNLEVWVRASVNNQWTEARIITVQLLVPKDTTTRACNLAEGKLIKASGYYENGYPENAVIAGGGTSGWRTVESTGAWLYVDLRSFYNVNKFSFKWGWDTAFGLSATSKIQVSEDAVSWVDIVQTTRTKENNWQSETISVPPVRARYVRFYASQWNGGWGALHEFKIYAQESLCALAP